MCIIYKKEINENGSSKGEGAMITMFLRVIFSFHWLTTQQATEFGHLGRKSLYPYSSEINDSDSEEKTFVISDTTTPSTGEYIVYSNL